VDSRIDLDDVKKINFLTLLELELGPLRRQARSLSLYQMRYPGSILLNYWKFVYNYLNFDR
jgi:hypothetical protein